MSIGFTVYIEFSSDAFTSVAANRCATPGSVFFWHHQWDMEILGLPITTRVRSGHPFGLRGIPKNLSRQVVRNHYLLISDNAPPSLAEKKRTRRFSGEDKTTWERQGLQFWKIPNDPAYEIVKLENEELLIDPGCQCPSWLTVRELKAVHASLEANINQPSSDHSALYNTSVYRWVFSLGDIYGDDCVRVVYWFDNLPEQCLSEARIFTGGGQRKR